MLLAGFLLVVSSCKKDDENSGGSGIGEKVTATIVGRVFDEAGLPIGGVTVTAGEETATTNQYGVYVLTGVSVDKTRAIVKASK